MITVRFYKKDAHYYGLEVSGHAYFDEPGKDIVCSAVSALATTGYNTLCHYIGAENLSLAVEEAEGYLKFEVKNPASHDQQVTDIVFKTIAIGIDSIAQTYTKHVTLKEGGGRHAKN